MLGALFEKNVAGPLASAVELVCVDRAFFLAEVVPLLETWFPPPFAVQPQGLYEPEARERFAALDGWLAGVEGPFYAVFRHEGRIAGGFIAEQEKQARLFMALTVLAPELRGQGLYGAFLERFLAFAREAGFREVYSYHHANNNAVLVAKLKAGFLVSGFEVNVRHGLLVRLSYPLSEEARRVHALRVGDFDLLEGLVERGTIRLRR